MISFVFVLMSLICSMNRLCSTSNEFNSLVSWGCRIHWLNLYSGVSPLTLHKCSGYDTKQSDGEAPVMLEIWEMQSIPSLLLLPGPFWPGVVAPERVLFMGQIEEFNV